MSIYSDKLAHVQVVIDKSAGQYLTTLSKQGQSKQGLTNKERDCALGYFFDNSCDHFGGPKKDDYYNGLYNSKVGYTSRSQPALGYFVCTFSWKEN